MNSEQSRLAAKFVKDNKIQHIDAELIKSILEDKGFSIVSFSHVVNDDKTELMIKSLFGIKAENMPPAASVDGKKGKFVFLCDELNQNDKLYALCVQAGLILSGNVSEKPNDTKAEADRKAHEFAESLIGISEGDVFEKARAFPLRTAVKTAAATVLLLTVCFAVCFCVGFYVCRLNYESSAVQAFSSYVAPGQYETYTADNLSEIPENGTHGVLPDEENGDKDAALFDEDRNNGNAAAPETEKNGNVFVPKSSYENTGAKTFNAQSENGGDDVESEISAEVQTAPDAGNPQTDNSSVYYMTANGTKYHKAGCSYIANKNNLKEIRSDSAELSKYSPCSRCFK